MRQENDCVVKDWKLIPFSSNIEMLSGFPFDSSQFNDSDGKPLIRIRNIKSGKTETFYKGEYSEEYLINKGDILIGMDGDFHIKKWEGSESLLNQRILKLYENEESEIHLDFFYYLSQPFLLKVHKRTAGTTVKHLSTKDFKNASFKVPDYVEQQKIAEVLSTVDAKIEVIDQQISQTQELKKGLMQRLLTKGIGHAEFKDSPLGKIPKSWEVMKIDDLFNFISTKSLSRAQLNYDEGEIFYVHYGDIHSTFKYPIVDLDKTELPRVNDEIEIKGNIEYLEQGDLILADASEDLEGVGICIELYNIADKKVLGGLHTIVLRDRLNKTADGFRTYLLSSPLVLPSLKRIATGASVLGVSKGNLKKIEIALPPISVQQKIAEILSSVDEKLEVLSEKKITYQDLKKGLMQQLLTGKVRVKVNDEA